MYKSLPDYPHRLIICQDCDDNSCWMVIKSVSEKGDLELWRSFHYHDTVPVAQYIESLRRATVAACIHYNLKADLSKDNPSDWKNYE